VGTNGNGCREWVIVVGKVGKVGEMGVNLGEMDENGWEFGWIWVKLGEIG
jgi:hypothetical protein